MPLKGSNGRQDQSGMVRPGTIARSDLGFSQRLSAKYLWAGRRLFRLPWMLFRRIGGSVAGKKRTKVLQIFLSVTMRRMPGRPQPAVAPLSDRIVQLSVINGMSGLLKTRPGTQGAAPPLYGNGGGRALDSGRRQGSREQSTKVWGPQRSDGGQGRATVASHGVSTVSRAQEVVDASRVAVPMPLAPRASFMIRGSDLNRLHASRIREIRVSHGRLTCLAMPGHDGDPDRWTACRQLQSRVLTSRMRRTSHTAQSEDALPGVGPRSSFLIDAPGTDGGSPLLRPLWTGSAERGRSDRPSLPRLIGTSAGPQRRRAVPEGGDSEFSFRSLTKIRQEVEEIRTTVREARNAVREESRSVQSLRNDVERYIKSKLDIHHLSDQVCRDIERRIRMERERRGL